jgi:5-methylcytosine-specific restriction endonuclease McrA
MPGDLFYSSKQWLALRDAVRWRARGVCEVPGCGHPLSTVDHIIARKDGGPDTLANLRALCRAHDNQVMQGVDGKRKSGGKLRLFGVDANGDPLGGWAIE